VGAKPTNAAKPVTGVTIWIVDYDLPATNQRRSFYRHIRAWLRERGEGRTAVWTTYSVVITPDREFAEFVFQEASQLGRATLFRGEVVAEGWRGSIRYL